MQALGLNDSNARIEDLLLSDRPCMVGRYGLTESAVCWWKGVRGKTLGKAISRRLVWGVGLYPNTPAMADELVHEQMSAATQADAMVKWGRRKVDGEDELLTHTCRPTCSFLDPASLWAFLMLERPWTRLLENQRVLVVHPFFDTILGQYERREKLFDNPSILPEFRELVMIEATQSIGGNGPDENWKASLDSMKADLAEFVRDDDFDIALIGCGGYGLPLAAHVKRLGSKAIHMGGSLQLLFGIKGKRWDTRAEVNRFYNEHWVRPSEDETPKGFKKVEGGCYW